MLRRATPLPTPRERHAAAQVRLLRRRQALHPLSADASRARASRPSARRATPSVWLWATPLTCLVPARWADGVGQRHLRHHDQLPQRARADTDWAEKLAAKQREKLRVEGEGLASSARAGRGTAVEDAVSRRLDPMAQKGGVAEAAEAATRAARRVPEQVGTRKGKEETRRQAQERKAMATEEKATRKAAERERKAKEREATRAAKAEAAETRARDREATKRAKAKMRAEARTKAAEAKATARAEAKEAKEAKEAAAKAAKAEAKAAKTTQQAAAKKAKAKARNKQAEAEEARATEQTQVEVAGSSGRGTETGEVHVYTGRARRASRRATGVG